MLQLLKLRVLQGLDTDANVLSPKVVEALLGTRFRGRQFGRGPLVCSASPHMRIDVLFAFRLPEGSVILQIAGSRLTLAIDGEGKVTASRLIHRLAAALGTKSLV